MLFCVRWTLTVARVSLQHPWKWPTKLGAAQVAHSQQPWMDHCQNSKRSAMSEDRTMLKLKMEPTAVEKYCRVKELNHYPCGLLIYPYWPWLGPSPHDIDDLEQHPTFGLVQVKYPNGWSYVNWLCILLLMGQLNWENPMFISGRSKATLLHLGGECCNIFTNTMTCSFKRF